MTITRRGLVAAVAAASLAGGALGATVVGGASGAATNTGTTGTNAAPAAGGPQSGGRFVPNEDPAHEKGESAQREAQENAGQFPTVR